MSRAGEFQVNFGRLVNFMFSHHYELRIIYMIFYLSSYYALKKKRLEDTSAETFEYNNLDEDNSPKTWNDKVIKFHLRNSGN